MYNQYLIFQNRLINFIFYIYNNIKMRFLVTSYGGGKIHGHFRLTKNENAIIKIGSHFYMSSGRNNPLSRNLSSWIYAGKNATIEIGHHVGVSSSSIWAHEKIQIGNYVNIGADTIIIDSDAHSLDWHLRRNIESDIENKKSKPIIIEDDVLIGTRCIILKGVKIGARSIIGAGSVVTGNIPPDEIWAGNPAKKIKSLI